MKNPYKVSVLLSGGGSNFRALYEASRDWTQPRIEFCGVVSDKENVGGVEFARAQGVNVSVIARSPKRFSREQFSDLILQELIEQSPDLVVMAGFMRLISGKILKQFQGRMINLHPALLPSFKGADGVGDALSYGVCFTGTTVHFVSEEMDSGQIIAQAPVYISASESKESITEKIKLREHRLLPLVVRLISEGKLTPNGPRHEELEKEMRSYLNE